MTPENDLPEAEPAPADFQPERVLPFISYTPQWALFFRRVVVVLLIICGVLAAYILSPVMQTLIVTALLCFLLYLPSRILAARTALNFPCSVMLVYLILIVLIVLGIVALVPSIVNVIQVVGDSLSQLLVRVRDLIEAATPENTVLFIPEANLTIDTWPIISPFKDALSGQIATAVAGVPALDVGAILSTLTSITASLIGSIASIVSSGFLAILLSFLILIDLPRYQNSAAHGIAPIYRREVFLLTGQINNVWSGFFRGQLVICVIIGALTWLQLTLMGIGNATGIAVIVALISLIPTIGGILALALTRQYLSVPSAIGFIAVFGVAMLNGIVLVSFLNELRESGLTIREAVTRGTALRLRPVLMTASVAILGLVPMLLSRGVGAETQRPLAAVVVGGLITSTLLTLVLLPVLYEWLEERAARAEETEQ